MDAGAKFRKSLPKEPLTTDGTISFDRTSEPCFSMGEGTHKVPMSMHAENRGKLCEALRRTSGISESAVIFLQGGSENPVYDTDTTFPGFRQESNFQYLFGVKEPDCLGAVRISDAKAILFVPQMPEEYQAWFGRIKPLPWFQRAYAVDEARHLEEAEKTLVELGSEILILQGGLNRDSGLRLPEPDLLAKAKLKLNKAGSHVLWDRINECRLVKSEKEIAVLQYVNDVSSNAHIEVMRSAKPGQREYVAEAVFRFQSSLRGCFRTGYNCICGSGRRNAILHYGHPAEPNSEVVPRDCMRMLDMGAEYHGYTADVSCSWPVAGTFTEPQRTVYEAVWAATLAVERRIRPGVNYKDMHRLAQRTMLESLKTGGLFVGEVEEMMQAGVMSTFMPHGLGHSLGLDTHDVGGYMPGESKKDDPTIKENLRLGRVLKEAMVITVEPGFYFVDYMIENLLGNPSLAAFVNKNRLTELWSHVGGIRIEDDVVITADGCRVLTCVPREVSEIEAVMAGQQWTVSSACCRQYHASKTSNA